MSTEVERFMSEGRALADISQVPAGHGQWQREYRIGNAGTVDLGRMLAQVAIVPMACDRVTLVGVDGDPEMLAALTAREDGGALRIEGEIPFKAGSGSGPFSGTFYGSGIQVNNFGGGTFVSSGGSSHAMMIEGREVDLSRYVRLVVAVPSAAGVRVSDLLGTVAITGDLDGSVDFSPSFMAELVAPGSVASLAGDVAGSGSATIGAVEGGADMEVSGSGSFCLGKASGPVAAGVSGSGRVTVCAGTSESLRASVSGSGRVAHQGVITGDARLRVSGSGHVNAVTVLGTVDPKVSGSGSIIANGRTYRPR